MLKRIKRGLLEKLKPCFPRFNTADLTLHDMAVKIRLTLLESYKPLIKHQKDVKGEDL